MRAVTVATMFLLAAHAQADRTPALEARLDGVRVLARIGGDDQTPLVIRGDLTGAARDRAVALAGELRADLGARLLARGRTTPPPVDVCLFRSDASYAAFCRATYGDGMSPRGFYMPSDRVVVANMSRGVGNLRHELTHALVRDDFPSIPAWLTEGLGALYGTSRPGRHGFEGLVNYRLRDLRAAIRHGRVPSLAALARSDTRDLYGPEGGVYYATARFALLYLQSRGRLEHFYRAARDGDRSPGAIADALAAEIDWNAFLSWTESLRWPPNAPPPPAS